MRLSPAHVVARADGTPYSLDYGDVYHGSDGGIAQSRHVFLGGCGLPARWAGRRAFTILETGFGLGLNFLVAWRTWRDDGARSARLHYVAVEKHPVGSAELLRYSGRHTELAPCAKALAAEWPVLVPGVHRLEFDAGRVTLTLAFGDVADMLPQLRCVADAVFLDGFAPDRNPEMWSPRMLGQCARLCAPDALAATFTAARVVRDNLQAAGFAITRSPGHARKRHMLSARLVRRDAGTRHVAAPGDPVGGRAAIVVGCGIAGAAVAERIAARGWEVCVIDTAPGPAGGASALHAGVLHPHLSRDDSILSRLVRAGFLYSRRRWRALEEGGDDPGWNPCGVARPARSPQEAAGWAALVAALGCPADYVEYLERDALGRRCGHPVAHGGLWFATAGIVQPRRLIAAELARSRATLLFDRRVAKLHRAGGQWHALSDDDRVTASAHVAVLANAADATLLAPVGHELRRIRGQLTYLPAHSALDLTAAVVGAGYALPAVDGIAVVGASYDRASVDTAPWAAGHRDNLAALARVLPEGAAPRVPPAGEGFAGLRAVASDRLPLFGAMPDLEHAASDAHRVRERPLPDFPRRPGLYGAFGLASRGLAWASLGGEILASLLEDEPAPIERRLLDAVDPARFALRDLRRSNA